MLLCHPWAVQRPPGRLGTAVGRALYVIRKMKEFSTLAEALAKMARSRWVVTELLLM